PLMVAYALTLRMQRRRVILLAVITVLGLAAYLYGFRTPDGHGNAREGLMQPVKLSQYVLLYLGTPFYYMTGERWIRVGQVAGLALVVLASVKAWRYLKAPSRHALGLALLTFIAYIVG